MSDATKTNALRALCWVAVVILPTGIICWLAHIHDIGILGVALPFMLVAERVFRKMLQACGLWGPKSETAAADPPNGGPAEPSGVTHSPKKIVQP